MNTRYRSTFKRRSTFRRRRSGPRLHRGTSPRWEVSDFFIHSLFTLPGGSASEQLVFFNIASISQVLQEPPPGTELAGVNTALGNILNKMLLGGIVFDWGWKQRGPLAADTQQRDNYIHYNTGLVIDKLASDAGSGDSFPNAVQLWSPWSTGFPSVAVAPNTPNPSTAEVNRPLRTLWNKTDRMSLGPTTVQDDEAGVLYVPNQQELAPRYPTVNKRLKLVLDENQGLYLYRATRNSPTFALSDSSPADLEFWARGTLYWRLTT